MANATIRVDLPEDALSAISTMIFYSTVGAPFYIFLPDLPTEEGEIGPAARLVCPECKYAVQGGVGGSGHKPGCTIPSLVGARETILAALKAAEIRKLEARAARGDKGAATRLQSLERDLAEKAARLAVKEEARG
jgi:hypothetical protein